MSMKHLLLALVFACGLIGSASAGTDFVKSAIQMGTSYCPDTKFDCDNIASQRVEIIAAANHCADMNFAIKEAILNDFSISGEYENCATPDRPYKNARGTNVYAICCVKKSDNNECEMHCTRYIDQK